MEYICVGGKKAQPSIYENQNMHKRPHKRQLWQWYINGKQWLLWMLTVSPSATIQKSGEISIFRSVWGLSLGAFLVKRLLLHTPHALASSLRRGLHSGFTCYWTRHIWGIRGICPRWSVHFNDTSSQGAYALLTHLVFMTWKRLFVSLVYLIQFGSSLLIKRLKNTKLLLFFLFFFVNIFLYIFFY